MRLLLSLLFALCPLPVLAQFPPASPAPYTPTTRVVDAVQNTTAACVTGDTLLFQGDFVNNDFRSVFLRVNHSIPLSQNIDVSVGQTAHYGFSWHAPASPGVYIIRVGMIPVSGSQVLLSPIEVTVTADSAAANLSPVLAAALPPAPFPASVTSTHYRYAFAFGQQETVQAGNFGKHAQIVGYSLYRPTFLSVSPAGVMVSAGYGSGEIACFGADGTYKFSSGRASTGGMVADVYGNLYTASRDNVLKTGPNGASFGGHGTGNGRFDGVRGIALDGHGDVYVADFYNNRVQKFLTDGAFISAFGSYGFQPGQFKGPTGVAVGAEGTVYVSDPGNNRIEEFSPDGRFLGAFGTPGEADGQMTTPLGIATDAEGSVYVADYGNNRIVKWSGDGKFLTAFGAQGTPENTLRGPLCVSVAKNGSVYVLDAGNSRVVVFDGS